MSKIFTNKKIWQKIAVILLIVLLFQFIAANPIMAADGNDDDGSLAIEWGGKLLSPVMSLLVTIGDGIMSILHSAIMGIDGSLMHADLDSSWWDAFKDFALAIITVAVGIALVIGGFIPALAVGVTSLLAVTAGSLVVDAVANDDAGVQDNVAASLIVDGGAMPNDLYLPAYTYGPEEIFKGNILLFNVDFFGEPIEVIPHTYLKKGENETTTSQGVTSQTGDGTGNTRVTDYYYYVRDGEIIKTSPQNSAIVLQSTISSWYSAIRNICLVAMLSVLVYIGIRMLLSSVASDKAKYLTMLKDWFVGLCLLFLMHYIMAFSVTMVQKLTDIVGSSVEKNVYQLVIQRNEENGDKLDELDKFFADAGISEDAYKSEDGQYYTWTTNLMGYLRLSLQFNTAGSQYIGLGICFLILVVFTLMFTFTYLKRLLYMAFLTIIAPLVALTYCIDKVSDGQAQGFNSWLKEYIFNLLIQPMHLLLYFILITSAFQLAGENIIYSLVAIGFMLPAEKLLRSLFGFEKAHTPPLLAGPAGTAVMLSGVNKLSSIIGKGIRAPHASSSSGGGKDSSSSEKLQTTRTHNFDRDMALASLPSEENNENDSATSNSEPRYTQQALFADYDDQETTNKQVPVQEIANDVADNNTLPNQEEIDRIRTNEKQGAAIEEAMQQEHNEDKTAIKPTLVAAPTVNQNKDGVKKKISGFASKAGNKFYAATRGPVIGAVAKNTGKKLAKGALGVAAGVPAGAAVMGLGTAAAIASGDPSKVWAAAGVGATAGYAAGKSIASSNVKAADYISPEVKQAYNSVYNNSDDKVREAAIKSKLDDDKLKQEIMSKIGNDETEKIYNDNTVEQFIRNGRTTADDIIAGHKLIQNGYAKNVDQATAVMETTEGLLGGKAPKNMTKKTRTEITDTLNEKFVKAYNGNERRAQKQTEFVMNASQAYLDAKAGKKIDKAITSDRPTNMDNLPNKK